MNPDWESLVFDPAWMQTLDRLAQKRFAESALAEEAATYVIEQLTADNWARCSAYSGKAKPQTFLYSIASNLIEEFARKRFGRVRPPAWIQQQGSLWVGLWKRLCLERLSNQRVIHDYTHDGRHEPEFIRETIRLIKARIPRCGEAGAHEVALDEMSENPGPADLEHQSDKDRLEQVLLLVGWVLNQENDHLISMMDNDHWYRRLTQLQEILDLSAQQQLLLKLVYQDGLALSHAATIMGLPAHRPGRILKKTLKQIAEALSRCRIELDDLQGLVEGDSTPAGKRP